MCTKWAFFQHTLSVDYICLFWCFCQFYNFGIVSFLPKSTPKKLPRKKNCHNSRQKSFKIHYFCQKKNLQKSTERCQKPKRIVGKNQKNIGSSQVFVKYSQKQTSNFSFFFKRWITARIVSSWKPHLARCKMMSLEKLLPFSKTYCITTATKSDYP